MRVRDFCFGLFVGLSAGWIAGWWTHSASEPRETIAAKDVALAPQPSPVPPKPAETRRPRTDPPPTDTPQPAPAPAQDRIATLRTGDTDALRRVDVRTNPLNDEEVGIIAGRLAAAQAAGDRALYLRSLEFLGASATPTARARLIEVLGDRSIPLSTLQSHFFHTVETWFAGAVRSPAIAAAARRRIEAHVEEGRPKEGLEVLGELVLQHGSTDDFQWFESLLASRETDWGASRALLRVGRPEVVAIIERRVADGKMGGDKLAEYARANSEAAWPMVSRLIAQLGRDEGASKENARGLLAAYGAAVPSDSLSAARDALVSLPTQELRIAAISAVEEMARRKLDVSLFTSILEEPILCLQAPGGVQQGYACMYGIQYNRIMWTARSAEALEAAAPRAGSLEKGFQDVAREIRREIADPWRAK